MFTVLGSKASMPESEPSFTSTVAALAEATPMPITSTRAMQADRRERRRLIITSVTLRTTLTLIRASPVGKDPSLEAQLQDSAHGF